VVVARGINHVGGDFNGWVCNGGVHGEGEEQ